MMMYSCNHALLHKKIVTIRKNPNSKLFVSRCNPLRNIIRRQLEITEKWENLKTYIGK